MFSFQCLSIKYKSSTYLTEIRSVLVTTSNQVSNRLGSLTTSLGNDNRVDGLLGRVFVLGLTESDTDTTGSRENGNSLFSKGNKKSISQYVSRFLLSYLVVGKTRVLERVDVLQVSGFRRELNVLTLNKERVVVLDNSPDQIGTHCSI